MIYKLDITIPPNTAQASAIRQDVFLFPGVLSKVDIRFPPGCSDLARCVIMETEHILFPTNPDTYFSGDTFPVVWDEHLVLTAIPTVLGVSCWNIDNIYEHTITVMFTVSEKEQTLDSYLSRVFGLNTLS